MPIDFFTTDCRFTSTCPEFGLCDNPPPAEDPAYIDEVNRANWIATVENKQKKEVEFYAIDHCVPLFKPNGIDRESRCDGLLRCENELTFVELKDRASNGWLKKGREQLTVTVATFATHHDRSAYPSVRAYVCNKQRPLANTGNNVHIQQFKDDTGLLLAVQTTIAV